MDLAKLNSEELSELQARIAAELEVRSRGSVELWNGREGEIAPAPRTGGFILMVDWANFDQSYTLWFPEKDEAFAAIAQLGERYGRRVEFSGEMADVDLTVPGCRESDARVRPHEA